MKKGSRKLESCAHIDYSPLTPDNPQSPICKMKHGWSGDCGGCMEPNSCPDYKPAWGRTLEAVKTEFGLCHS